MSILKTKWFDCECSDSDHAIRFCWFEDDDCIFIDTQMNKAHGFWVRLKIAIIYLFDFKNKPFNHFQDTILNKNQTQELAEFLIERVETMKNEEE